MHRFAKVVAAATLLLIFAGALVKSTGTGFSDHTWPEFNGGYLPRLLGTMRFEHAHRMIAGTVALLAIALALVALRRERRAWVRGLAGAAVAAVLFQAFLGGLTVWLKLESLAVSIGHVALAEIFLGLTFTLAAVTAPSWVSEREPAVEPPRLYTLGRLTAITAVATFAEILLGAWVRYVPGAATARSPSVRSFRRSTPSRCASSSSTASGRPPCSPWSSGRRSGCSGGTGGSRSSRGRPRCSSHSW